MDHNLNIVELYHDLTATGDQLRLVGNQLQYRPHQGQGRSESLATLRQHKDALLAWLRERAATETAYPLSQCQLGLWLDWQRNPDTSTYNVLLVARLHEHVQVDILRQAAQFLLDRHPALRTVYLFTAEGPQQQVQICQTVDFALVDGTTWTETEVQAWIDAEVDHPFDLATGPLMRMRLLQRACHTKEDNAEKQTAAQVGNQQGEPSRYLLHWTFHHIATDLFTLETLQEELHRCYRALLAGEQPRLPTEGLGYRDFVRWEEETLRANGEPLAAFWRSQLGDEPVLLNLPVSVGAVQPAGKQKEYCQAVDFTFNPQLVQQLRAYARANRTTLYTLLLAAYQVLISRYTGQERFFVTSPTTVRELAGLRDTVGCLINAILLRADLQSEPDRALDFATLLRRTQATVAAAMAHHLFPYHAILQQWHSQIAPEQLQQGLVGFLYETIRRPLTNSDLYAEVLTQDLRNLPEPLSLFIFDSPEQLAGRITYHANQFDPAFIERMAGHFIVLLEGIVTQPEQPVLQLPLLTTAEYHQIVHEWNDTTVDFGLPQTIQALFEAQVARTPDAVAVVMAEDGKTRKQGDVAPLMETLLGRNSPLLPLSLSNLCRT